MIIYKVDWAITTRDKNDNLLNKEVEIWITEETYKEVLKNFNYKKEDYEPLEQRDIKDLPKEETLKDLFWFINN